MTVQSASNRDQYEPSGNGSTAGKSLADKAMRWQSPLQGQGSAAGTQPPAVSSPRTASKGLLTEVTAIPEPPASGDRVRQNDAERHPLQRPPGLDQASSGLHHSLQSSSSSPAFSPFLGQKLIVINIFPLNSISASASRKPDL